MWKLLIVMQLFWIGGGEAESRKHTCTHEYTFPCLNGDCLYLRDVCNERDDCGDGSDESFCEHYYKYYYWCADDSHRYIYMTHCDGKVDCRDASDETQCWRKSCLPIPEHERCFHGACTTNRDWCCATREGSCVSPHADVLTLKTNKTLIYADGRDLFSLKIGDNISRHLHKQAKFNITALTHSVEGNMIFWMAGRSIWNMTLTAEDGCLYGEIEISSTVLTMAYDWMQANFYLAFEDPKLIACHRRAGSTEMLCSRPIEFHFKQIDWLAVNPHAGLLYIGSFTRLGLEIASTDGQGKISRMIHYERESEKSHIQMRADATNIYILRTDGEGSLSVVSALDSSEKQITRNITEAHTTPLALFSDVAILRVRNETHALMFWENKTVVTRKKLNIQSSSRLFALIDRDAQPKGENRCDTLGCEQLCLLVPDGVVCECDAKFELMSDGKSCEPIEREKVNRSRYHCAINDQSYYYDLTMRCDGRADCEDASDETQCWRKSCLPEHERCFHGGCTTNRDRCCATREGSCIGPHADALILKTRETLIYANGRDLYSLVIGDSSSRHLHKQEKFDITALTHSVSDNMIFWIAGQSIWNRTLAAEDGGGRIYGDFEITSPILAMSYDWTTSNFYLAFEDPKLVVCHRRAQSTEMLCSRPIQVAVKQIDWLELHPHEGRMYMGSFTQPGVQVAAADCDGGNSRLIYGSKSGNQSDRQLGGDAAEIHILRTDGEGSLSALSRLTGFERRITRNITEAGTVALAMGKDVAILLVHNEIQALMFWENGTVVTRRKLNIPLKSRLFTLIDADAQVEGGNRCDNRTCDQLCLLVPHDAVCKCYAGYKLMEDDQTCVSREPANAKFDDKIILDRSTTIVAIAAGLGCLVLIYVCVLVRKKIFRSRTVSLKTRASINLAAENSPISLEY